MAQNREIYRRTKAAGGTLYPVGALALSEDEWSDYFGPAAGPFAAAKQAFDPDHVLTPGYDVFPAKTLSAS